MAVTLMAYLVLLRTKGIRPGQPWSACMLEHRFGLEMNLQHFSVQLNTRPAGR